VPVKLSAGQYKFQIYPSRVKYCGEKGRSFESAPDTPPVHHQRKRSFERLRKILLNQECEEVPLFEIGADQEIVRAVLGRLPPLERPSELIRFYWGLGYDYVPVGVSCFQEDPHLPSKEAEDTALLSRGKRSWAPMDGVVKTREDYERFPWPDPDRPQTNGIGSAAEQLPEEMKVVAVTSNILEPIAERIMGVKALSRCLYTNPDLLKDVCARLGEASVAAAEAAAEMDEVGAVCCCDDMGYQSGPLIPPRYLKKYILYWHRRMVKAVHAHGKPAILHSCGNIQSIMDDIIDYCGYDAKHSFKDSHTPVAEAKRRWGDRIALLGGVDMDFISRRSEGEVRTYVRRILNDCAGRGYALGTGNSVSNYIPVDNYLAMVDEGLKYRLPR